MNWQLFLIPLVVMFLIQVSKVLFYKGAWDWYRLKRINNYGGMPSSHSAMVTSLVYTLGHYYGTQAPSFAVAVILAIMTIRDAYGFRQAIGKQGAVINQLVKELPDDREYQFPILGEKFGHKTIEVIIGVIIGIILSYLLFRLF